MFREIQIPFDGKAERQSEMLQVREHQIPPLPFEQMAITEQPPVVAFPFGFGDKPCSSSHRIEILDEDFGIESFLFL